jgi:hypothetical protein
VKKLLALAIVGGFIALTVGCPSPSTPPPASKTGGTPTPPKTDPKKEGKTHEGKVVKLDGTKLKMKSGDNEMSHEIKDAKITVNGKAAEAKDLIEGMEITVTVDEKDVVTKVDAKKAAEPPKAETKTQKGKFGKLDGTKLTITDDDKKDHTFDLKDSEITRDGKKVKADELKADDQITVTTEDGKVTKVDAKPK